MKKLMVLMTVLLAFMACSAVMADDITGQFGVGATVGLMKPVGGGHDYAGVDPFGGGWLRYGLSSRWSLEAGMKAGRWHRGATAIGDDAGLSFSDEGVDYTNMWQAMGGLRFNLDPDSRWNPYLGAHAGLLRWRVVDADGSNELNYTNHDQTQLGYNENGELTKLELDQLTITLSLGVERWFADNWSWDFGARYHWLVDSDRDNIGTSTIWGPQEGDFNDGMIELFAGATWYFGGGDKDSDRDGIMDADDNCPKVAEDFDGFEDADGCPDVDNDGDGILDADDQCPDQAEDVDGFEDADGCPDLDNDGDGVPDVRDKCPNDPEDIDGYMDRDGCPDVDNDGDGVLDVNDQCPDTPEGAEVDANGCPKVEKRDLILKGVNFELNSANLTPESSATLDQVAESMTIWDTITIEVAGHTDSTGSAEYNQKLSQARAETVLNYLASKGISRDRMKAVGYGETMPIADNATPEGRAKNRRVELNRTD